MVYCLIRVGPATPGEPGGMAPTFLRSRKKKGKQGKKRKSSKAETIKRLSPRSKCYCLAILERLEFKKFSCQPAMMADITFKCSMVPAL